MDEIWDTCLFWVTVLPRNHHSEPLSIPILPLNTHLQTHLTSLNTPKTCFLTLKSSKRKWQEAVHNNITKSKKLRIQTWLEIDFETSGSFGFHIQKDRAIPDLLHVYTGVTQNITKCYFRTYCTSNCASEDPMPWLTSWFPLMWNHGNLAVSLAGRDSGTMP